MEITCKSFKDFVVDQKQKKPLGMVVMGAGDPQEAWIEGISNLLLEEKIVKRLPCFDTAYVLSGNVKGPLGRTDLVIYFRKDAKANVGKLAIWRIQFGKVSWTDDFIDNYGKDYGFHNLNRQREEEEVEVE
jgi:hypothetical protein